MGFDSMNGSIRLPVVNGSSTAGEQSQIPSVAAVLDKIRSLS